MSVVSRYKHLSCIVDAFGSLVPEARNREKSAMSYFAPLSKQLLGSTMLGVTRRIKLACSLVMSRLFFGVHTWSHFTGRPRTILYGNTAKMKGRQEVVVPFMLTFMVTFQEAAGQKEL